MSERGIGYWRYVPQLFDWPADVDHSPCPLDLTYQLARNVMAACVRADGAIETERAHALLVYDAQNPAFRPGGVADAQCAVCRGSGLRGCPESPFRLRLRSCLVLRIDPVNESALAMMGWASASWRGLG